MIKFLVITLEWFDKINGNSYFASKIQNTETKEVFYNEFEYGYGSHSEHRAIQEMAKKGWIDSQYEARSGAYQYENNYPIHFEKHEKCLKRELLNISK